MANYILRRLFSLIPTLLVIILFAFVMIRLVPGDPVQALMGDYSSPEAEAALRTKLGLDRPFPYQFWRYMRTVLTGDLGDSIRSRRPVIQEILIVFPHTLLLAISAMLVAILLALPVGIFTAKRRGTMADVLAMIGAVVGRSIPRFWLAIVLLLIFSLKLGWLPAVGAGNFAEPRSILQSMILPAIALGVAEAAFLTRVIRSTFLDELSADYVRALRSKGVSEGSITYKHVLRNSLIPVLTVFGLSMGQLLGGSVTAEIVFSRPGIGTLLVNSVYSRDYPMVQGIILFFAIIFASVNLLIDVSYAFADPRIRYE